MSEPRFTDQQLRADLASGLRPVDIAAKYGVSRAAVSKRVNRLELTTAAAVYSPPESQRYTSRTLDALGELTHSLGKVHLLMDACDAWLRDASDPSKYDVGARSGEVDVAYQVEVRTETGYRTEKRKKKLGELLGLLEGQDEDGARFVRAEKGEYRHADPRELILKTAQEVRATVHEAADLARLLADARAMQALREAIIDEVTKVDRDTGKRIADAVRRTILVHGAVGGVGSLPPGAGSAN